MKKTNKETHKTLYYDFGCEDCSRPFEFDVEENDTYYNIMAKAIIKYYEGVVSKENIMFVRKMISDECISEGVAFEIACDEIKDYYEEDAHDAYGGYYD